jgi:uncharacterized phiE125 gp8 family phage protein
MKITTEGTLVNAGTGTDAANEPVSLEEAKLWLRIDSGTADDALLNALISSARKQAELYTGRAFLLRNFTLNMDAEDVWPGCPIKLTRQPLVAVSSFQYRDADGSYAEWGTGSYVVDTPGARLSEGTLGSFPVAYAPDAGAYKIPFQAGYGTLGTHVPEPIRTAIKTQVLIDYENRGGHEDSDGNLHPAVRTQLNPFRVDLL